MTGTTIPHVTVAITEAIDITDVTTGVIGGDGVLDKLLSTMTEHLTAQYEKRRITGVEYATLYLGAYQATLQQALVLTAAKEIQAYEIKNLDWEAKLKEAQYNLAVKQLEIAEYELGVKAPVEVANLTKQGNILTAEAAQKAKDLEISTYELSTKLPIEVANLTKQGLSIVAETSLKDVQTSTATYVLANQLPVEVANLTKQGLSTEAETALKTTQNATAAYVLSTQLPAEVVNLTKQGLLITAQTAMSTKELETATYNLTNRVPAEVTGIYKQNTLLDGQATLQTKEATLKDLEATLVTAKTAGETANTASTNKQTELYERKRLTEVAQLDGTGILPGSVLDSQRDLLDAQTLGLERDAKQKVAKQMLDVWVARSTIIDTADVSPVNKVRDEEVGAAVGALFASIGLALPA